MADWHELVRQRLSGLPLGAAEKREVQAELASHLEDACEALRAEGLPETDAVQRALAQVPDWKDLQKKIVLAKQEGGLMQKRLQQLWIPGFLTLILSTFSLMTAQTCGFHPPIFWSGPRPILLYVPWLLSLPPLGALGAYLSSRAGGSLRTILLVSVFPVVALTTAFLLMFPIGWISERARGNHSDFGFVATVLLKDGIGWLLLPGIALVAGGLLAHFLISRRPSSRDMAIG